MAKGQDSSVRKRETSNGDGGKSCGQAGEEPGAHPAHRRSPMSSRNGPSLVSPPWPFAERCLGRPWSWHECCGGSRGVTAEALSADNASQEVLSRRGSMVHLHGHHRHTMTLSVLLSGIY